jgi:hypothetical protein
LESRCSSYAGAIHDTRCVSLCRRLSADATTHPHQVCLSLLRKPHYIGVEELLGVEIFLAGIQIFRLSGRPADSNEIKGAGP